MKGLKFKLPLYFVIIDILLYLFLFHSGITLPIINPSVEEYNQQFTSFPRDYMQKIVWIGLHVPTSFAVDSTFGDNLLGLSVVQTGLIFFGIGSFIDYRRKTKQFATKI